MKLQNIRIVVRADLVPLQHELARARDAARGRRARLARGRQRAQLEPELLQVRHQRHLRRVYISTCVGHTGASLVRWYSKLFF